MAEAKKLTTKLVGPGEEVLGQFLGDKSFPVKWESEAEKELFWVYDDLHCPHPLSPMYEDIGGWWMSCDHMFRRFGTPFATDWIYKNVNGYCYTAAIPAQAGLSPTVSSQEYGSTYHVRVPLDPEYAAKIGTYLGAVLPTYGLEFATWWTERYVPEMKHNFVYLEGKLDQQGEMTLMELACLLEDAIDIHDRHWKIHWMLNFGGRDRSAERRRFRCDRIDVDELAVFADRGEGVDARLVEREPARDDWRAADPRGEIGDRDRRRHAPRRAQPRSPNSGGGAKAAAPPSTGTIAPLV